MWCFERKKYSIFEFDSGLWVWFMGFRGCVGKSLEMYCFGKGRRG